MHLAKQLRCGTQQLCRRMNATLGMADERPFEVDSQRTRTARVAVIVPDRFAQMFQ